MRLRADRRKRGVGLSGKVVALEANAHDVAARPGRIEIYNSAHQLTILHAAAAERSGVATINYGLNASLDDVTGGWGRVETPALSLDDPHSSSVTFTDLQIIVLFHCHLGDR